ncbi:MAG: ABC transporter permease [Alphaproteobacteria bacterium]|nr:ABC transporter permease [Alphaproteobacteria bacterium]
MRQHPLSFRRLRAIMLKEFTQLRRDRSTFAMIILIPIFQLLLFGYAINSDPKHMPTAVLSQDHSSLARSFVAALKNSDYFQIQKEVTSPREAKLFLQTGLVQFVVTIPENFHRDVVRGDAPSVLIEADATDPMAMSGPLSSITEVMAAALRHEIKGPLSYLKEVPAPANVIVHRLYNPEGFSRYNIVPGLMGVVLTMTGIMMTALAMTRERERGTMENLLSMPVRPIEVMAGKVAPYIIIGYIQSLLIVIVAKFLFGVPLIGSLVLLFSVLLIFIICNLALGFMLSVAAKNQTQALQLSIFPVLPSILLSGFMFPFYGMPQWAQFIGNCLPLTYFARIVRGILLKGNDFVEVWPHIWPLLIFMTVITVIAMKLYKQTLD